MRFLVNEASSAPYCGPRACFAALSPRIAPSWTHLCHQPFSAEVEVGQRQRSEGPRGILFQPAVAHLAKTPQALDYAENMLHPRPNAGLVAVLAAGFFIDDSVASTALVGEVFGLGCFAVDQILLAGIG